MSLEEEDYLTWSQACKENIQEKKDNAQYNLYVGKICEPSAEGSLGRSGWTAQSAQTPKKP